MKAICILNESDAVWTRTYFGCGPALVPILNKALLEYYLDFFELLKITEIRISQDEACDSLRTYFEKRGTFRNLKISFALHKKSDNLQVIFLKNLRFFKKDSIDNNKKLSSLQKKNSVDYFKNGFADVLIFRGFSFIHYDKNKIATKLTEQKNGFLKNIFSNQYRIDFLSTSACFFVVDKNFLESLAISIFANKNNFHKTLENGKEHDVGLLSDGNEKNRENNLYTLKVTPINNLKDYFYLSMQLLKKENKNYVLAGHSSSLINIVKRDEMETTTDNNKKFLCGKGLRIEKKVDVQFGTMLGNHVHLKKGVSVGQGSILGSYVIVDEDTILRDTIVLNGVYLGKDLFLNEAIITGKYIIKPLQNEILALDDSLIISAIPETRIIFKFFYRFFSLVIAFFLLPLAGLANIYACVIKIPLVSHKLLFDRYGGEEIYFPKKTRNLSHIRNILQKVFFRLSLDKFFLLPQVVKGNLWIAGNTPLPATFDGRQSLAMLNQYYPAVFTFSDAFKNSVFLKDKIKKKSTLGFDNNLIKQNDIDELYFSHHLNLVLLFSIFFRAIFLRLFKRGDSV